MPHLHLRADKLNFDEPSTFGFFNEHKGFSLFRMDDDRAMFVEHIHLSNSLSLQVVIFIYVTVFFLVGSSFSVDYNKFVVTIIIMKL